MLSSSIQHQKRVEIPTLHPFNLDSYDYELPKDRIASHPASPRTIAKLLVYNRNTQEITHSHIYDIQNHLPKECAIIMNDTKVIKARLFGNKINGGKIEILYIKYLSNLEHEILIKGRVKVGSELQFDGGLKTIITKLNDDGSRIVKFSHEAKELDFDALLPFFEKYGHTPLPPYIQRADTAQDEADYQSRFAKNSGSVAAPTASLHFDDELLNNIINKHESAYVTLHIGLGTFKNVEANDIRKHQIHTEKYYISDEAKDLIDSDAKILCIGTTACRSVEHYYRKKVSSGECDIFLNPSNPPQRVDHLLTNFHLPKSTLIMLVSSLIGLEKTMEIYKIAIENDYRFYSFGDAMLIL